MLIRKKIAHSSVGSIHFSVKIEHNLAYLFLSLHFFFYYLI